MKKTLRYLSFLAAFFLSFGLNAQQTTTVNYCPNDPTDEMKAVILKETSAVSMQAAIVIPAERTAALRGAKITKIRFYADEGMIGTYAWVKGGLTTPALGSPVRVGTTVQGWNEVVLAKPVEITDRDFVVGFEGSVPAGKHIYVAGPMEHQSNINIAKEGWNELSAYGFGSLCIQAVVEGADGMVFDDLALQSVKLNKSIFPQGEEAVATVVVGNYGNETANVPAIAYSVNGVEYAVPVEGTFAPNTFKTINFSVSAANSHDGVNDLKVWIKANDSYQANNSADLAQLYTTKMYDRKVLIEHFTTLQCGNCPNGLKTLQYLTEGRDDYAWVAHHVGYGTDELTQNISNSLINPLGIGGAPSASFSRMMVELSESNTKPSFGIGYTSPRSGADKLRPSFNGIINEGSCVKIGISNSYDEAASTLTTNVSAVRNSVLSYLYPDAQLSVWIVEDGCKTTAGQSGSGDKIHDHVFRTNLTPTLFGEEIEWEGDQFSKTFTYTVPAGYDPANMKVVAFIAMPNTPGTTNLEVINVNKLDFFDSETAGINPITTGESEVLKREYYDLQGRPLQAPNGGLYIERVYTTDGVKTYKRL